MFKLFVRNYFNNVLIFKQISNFYNFSKHSYISYLFKMFYVFAKNFKIH